MKPIFIEIERLGAIQDSKIEIKPFMVFSGKSGLGKSYIAMLIHYVYKVMMEDEVLKDVFVKNDWTVESMIEKYGNSGSFEIPLTEIWEYVNEKAKDYMKSMTGNPNIEMSVKIIFPITNDSVKVNYEIRAFDVDGIKKQSLHVSVNDFNTDMPFRGIIGSYLFRVMFLFWLRKEIIEDLNLKQVCLLPPGRGALLSVPIEEQKDKSAGLFSEFIYDWNIIRVMPPEEEIDNDLSQMLNKINGGEITTDSSKNLYYCIPDVKPMPLSASASSVKELTPLSLLLSKFPAKELSVLFEEPEAHLHPSKQIEVADFLVEMIAKGAHLQITTHSDYIIRRINDRIILNKIKNKYSYNEFRKICDEYKYSETTLDENLVGAYLLKQKKDDGTVEVVSQTISDEGIPYATFKDVITDEILKSLDIQNKLKE